jgi:hypothetical protein
MSNSKTYYKTDGSKVTITEDDYKKAREMTEEERHQAALSDPDALPLTEDELKLLKPVNPRKLRGVARG